MLQKPQTIARIGVMNNIAKAGLDLFNGSYDVGKDMQLPDALLVRSAPVDTSTYNGNLVAVARAGIGTDKITVDKATEAGVCVFNTPGANAQAVAELVMAMIGTQSRRIFEAVALTRSLYARSDAEITKAVEEQKSQFVGRELANRTLGVIGLGKIGVLVANLGVQKGMRVIGFDEMLTTGNAHQLSTSVSIARSLDQLLELCDVITVHVPLTEKTRHLIGEAQLEKMRQGCMLVNYSREGVYDDEAVLCALESKKIATYISDFPSQKLLHSAAICTPHLGASTEESEEKCAMMAVSQLKAFFETGTVTNSVNFPTVEMPIGRGVRTRLVIVNRNVPNMLAAITGALGAHGINIAGSVNQNSGAIAYSLFDTDHEVPREVIAQISCVSDILKVRAIRVG